MKFHFPDSEKWFLIPKMQLPTEILAVCAEIVFNKLVDFISSLDFLNF